eukprot:m.45936 g.45936  ORF g.45936 m.45936 type:complete len:93 (-) comp10908_c0_seq4:4979-5257(-)
MKKNEIKIIKCSSGGVERLLREEAQLHKCYERSSNTTRRCLNTCSLSAYVIHAPLVNVLCFPIMLHGCNGLEHEFILSMFAFLTREMASQSS